ADAAAVEPASNSIIFSMLVSDFQYDLPPERIAQEPLADRAGSRLLHLTRLDQNRLPEGWQSQSWLSQNWHDRKFRDFPVLLRPDDLLVVNNTRVFPARLYGHRSAHRNEDRAQPLSPQNPAARNFLRGQVEVLLTRHVVDNAADDPVSNHSNEWECLVRPGRKVGIGERLYFGGPTGTPSGVPPELEAEVIDRDDRAADRQRYQTVYAQALGSVAAPTAGLHFTPEILEQIRGRGIEIAEITLHVGLGTFQPVRVEKVEDHKLHRERYNIPAQAAEAINRARAAKRRVVAVGTTTLRTLEYAAERVAERTGENRVEAGCGEADAFIYPGYRFRIVNALLTNFHLPQSTLLMLVCALGGKELVMAAYRHAVEAGYRFYSYGDCMFVE